VESTGKPNGVSALVSLGSLVGPCPMRQSTLATISMLCGPVFSSGNTAVLA